MNNYITTNDIYSYNTLSTNPKINMKIEKKNRANQVLITAAISRVITIILACFVINPLIRSAHTLQLQEEGVLYYLRGFLTWDADHFWQLSKNGYLFDKNHAFFPLLPYFLSAVRMAVAHFTSSPDGITLIVAIIIGNLAHIFSCYFMYRLSIKLLGSEKAAFRSTMLYIINPASIYFSSLYNESYYALFSLAGIYMCEIANGYKEILYGAGLFSLAGCCRSNAVCLSIFVARGIFRLWMRFPKALNILQGFAAGLISAFFVLLPFWLFTSFLGYQLYCKNPENAPQWCQGKIPSIYSHIQSKYWQVGFLRSIIGNERIFDTAVYFSIPYNLLAIISLVSFCRRFSWSITIPYCVSYVFLLLTVFLLANPEINTRICASCPLIYWVFAQFQFEAENNFRGNTQSFWDYLKKYGYVAYASIYFIAEMFLVPTFIGWI